MLQQTCVCVCLLRPGNTKLIGINTASSVCTAHFCITLPSLPSSLPFLPLPWQRRGGGGGVGRKSSCWEVHLQPKSPLKNWSVILELAVHFSQRHYVDLKGGSSERIQSHTFALLSWIPKDELPSPWQSLHKKSLLCDLVRTNLWLRWRALSSKSTCKTLKWRIGLFVQTDEALRELTDVTVLTERLRSGAVGNTDVHDAGILKHMWPCD